MARTAVFLLLCALGARPAGAQADSCTPDTFPGIVWRGSDRTMPLSRLAAYLAPVFWFSPDEPSLRGAEGAAIRTPDPLPADPAATAPVVYYQLDRVLERGNLPRSPSGAAVSDASDPLIDFERTFGFDLTFLLHFDREHGLGAHNHDVEPAELRAVVLRPADLRSLAIRDCRPQEFTVYVTRTTGKAHGLVWFWNILETDAQTRFPVHLLVEEGKHALATDKNGDGVFTPGYDANRRVNDAWGVRDVISTGHLFHGGYEPSMAKVRRPEHRILPPLPADSRLRPMLDRLVHGVPLATYELRRFPGVPESWGDRKLAEIVEHQVQQGGTRYAKAHSTRHLARVVDEGAALHALSISYRTDNDHGFSFVFPFFGIRHLEDPLTGGYIVHRMYLKDARLRDFGWMAMFAPSASRWLDTYIAAGAEWDWSRDSTGTHRDVDFVFETGLKFRLNVRYSPLKFLGAVTPYWGVRGGVKATGFFDIKRLIYVLEVGAGAF